MITRRNVFTGAMAFGAAGLAGEALAEGKLIRVPLTLAKYKPVVEVKIGGKGPYRFVLDTGASATVIRADLARELGLNPIKSGKTYSIKGSETANAYVVPEVVIGGALHLHNWLVIDSQGFEKSGFDGLLSADLLTRFQCQLDYQAREIRYYAGQKMDLTGFGPLTSFYKSGVKGEANKVHLKLTFPEHAIDCILDTGADAPLYIRGDYVKANGLWDKYPIITESRAKGVNGQTVRTRMVEIKDFQVGGIWVPRMTVVLADPEDTEAYGQEGVAAGLVGASFLSAFTLAFSSRKVYVKSTGQLAVLAPQQNIVSKAPPSTAERPVIPFRLGDERNFIFPFQSGGKKLLAAFWLGNGRNEIGEETARILNLPKLAAGGFDASALSFSGTTIPGLVLMPAKAPKSAVILGADFVRRTPCLLDLDDNYMALYPSGRPDLGGYDPLPVAYDALGRPWVSARVAGRDLKLRLNTGSAYGIIVTPAAVKRENLWDAFPGAEDRLAYNAGGAMSKTRYAVVSGLEFGPYRIDPAPLTLADPEAAMDAGEDDFDGAIGIGVLWRFNMIFADDKVWFQPNKRFIRNANSRPPA